MNRKVIIAKTNIIAYEYLTQVLVAISNSEIEILNSKNYYILQVEVADEFLKTFCDYVARSIIVSQKYKILISGLKNITLSYANVACFSALLHFDIENEVERTAEIISAFQDISIEGVFDFKLSDFAKDWRELEGIGEILAYESKSEDDIYNVTNFMMSTRVNNASLFLAQYPDILLANVTDGVVVDSINLYKNNDYNLINAIIAECPNEIIVEKNQIKSALLDCLSRIVKVKQL